MDQLGFVRWARAALGVLALVGVFRSPRPAGAQGLAADYERADRLRDRAQGKVVRDRVVPRWFAGNDRFWYRLDLLGGAREFIVVDAVRGERRPAFDHPKFAAALAKAAGLTVAADRLPIESLRIEDDGKVRFESAGKGWSYDPAADVVAPADVPDRPSDPVDDPAGRRGGNDRNRQGIPRGGDSPDGRWSAFIVGHNLCVRDKAKDEEFALSEEGTEGDGYQAGVFWSPDSRKVVALRVAKGDDRRVQLIESSPKDQLQPKLSSYEYAKPGDRLPIAKPHLFDVGSRKPIAVSDALFENPWSLDEVRWSPDSRRFTFLYNQRGHQVLRVVAVDAGSGDATALIDERSSTFVDYSNKTFLRFLDKSEEILWMSERDGWNHLYLLDGRTGAVKNQVTRGGWLVRGVDRVDEDRRQVWFRVNGIAAGEDPYHIHHARVDLDGSNLVRLTEGDGNHALRFSPDRRFAVDTYSRVDLPPVTEVRRVDDGKLACEVERGDDSALRSSGWAAPERFAAKGRDGKTDIHGVIFRPTNLDSTRKYPVIEAIYAGPHGAHVPKAFAAHHRAQALAELGFVVVQVDGMGTNWRARAFHDVCWKNLADAGFPDRIAWIKAAAGAHPYMDTSRVGIYGGSAGGQNALGALLFHGDFYKAAAADCGCHDNRMDKIWWNEAWMGWPVGPHYAEQSNVTNAARLRGALLLTVGELDRNVDPASTMQVVAALIRANKDFDLVVFPGADHGAGGGAYGERRRRDFFVRHLLRVEPPPRNGNQPPVAEDRPGPSGPASGPAPLDEYTEDDEEDE